MAPAIRPNSRRGITSPLSNWVLPLLRCRSASRRASCGDLGRWRAGLHRPGASEVQIFAAEKDINGNRKSVFHNCNAEDQTTLPGGEYMLVTTKDGTETAPPPQ